MKKIISNRLYDTDTAKKLGSWTNSDTGIEYVHEELYRKRTGEFFLFGEGGAKSVYNRRISQERWAGGETIVPMTVDAAKAWAEKHMAADAYQSVFGEIEDDESRVVLSITLTKSLAESLRRNAAANGMSLSAWIEKSIK